ncbi:hypothetical protein H2248_007437 [Termitomyces sp. 'cryptogamus']|nr:hypothetical protein H2248_007437 [Termitomyces sp. 'cryptogamus']
MASDQVARPVPATPVPRVLTPTAPSTPTTPTSRSRIPAFTPRTPKIGLRSPTPEGDFDSDDDSSFSPAQIPKGNQLIVRGCTTDVPAETPSVLVKDLLLNLGLDPQYDYFQELPLVVSPFSDRPSNVSSACYVELKFGGVDSSMEPRVDLLENVMRAISEARPNWEVRWSASRKGRSDKRLSCRLLDLYPGVTARNDIPVVDLPVIRDHIEKLGYRVASIFASYGGPQVTFLLPSDADKFMALGTFAVPAKVSKHMARIEPLKEIPIERPFELVVSGMRDWELMELRIEKWVRKTAPGSWIGGRTTDLNSDLFIFSLATWADTLRVLRAEESFKKVFPESIASPRQLWDYNDNPTRRTLGDQVSKGADLISGTVKSMVAEIREMKSELQSVQIKLDNTVSSHSKLINHVMSLDQRLCTTQQALLVQGREEKIRSRIVELESQIGSLRMSLLFPADQQRKEEIQGLLEGLMVEIEQKRQDLTVASNQLASVIGIGPEVPDLPSPPGLPGFSPLDAATSSTPSAMASAPLAIRPGKKRKTINGLVRGSAKNSTAAATDAEMVCFHPSCSNTLGSINADSRPIRLQTSEVNPTHTNAATLRVKCNVWRDIRRGSHFDGCRSFARYIAPSFPAFSNFKALDHHSSCFFVTLSSPSITCPTMPDIRPDTTDPSLSRIVPVTLARTSTFNVSSPCLKDNPITYIPILHTVPCSRRSLAFTPSFLSCTILFILMFSLLFSCAMAQPVFAQSQISVCALNANGLMNPVKLAYVGQMIAKLAPLFFAISETKTRSNAGTKLPISNYEIFEENGVPCSMHRGKWGIVLGVRKDVQIVSQIQLLHPTFRGRVVAVDVVIPCSLSSSFVHRVFAVYAPCDPGLDDLSREFWPHLTEAVCQTKTSWTLFGDLNATVSSMERAMDNPLARQNLRDFLLNTNGTDLWQLVPDRSRFTDWTSRAWHSNEGGSIIDRVVSSSSTLVDFEINTDQTWIPGTDHRAVVAKVIVKSNRVNHGQSPRTPMQASLSPVPPPRIKYPSKADKHKFVIFADAVDHLVDADKASFEAEINSDDAYTARYVKLTEIIMQVAVNTFGRGKPFCCREKKITSPAIRGIVAKIRHIGGSIAMSRGVDKTYSYGSHRAFESLRSKYDSTVPQLPCSFTEFLIDIRRAYYRDLYAAKKAEIWDRAKRRDLGRISGVLSGGSVKKFMGGSSAFISLPTALKSPTASGSIETDPQRVAEMTRKYFLDLYKRTPPPDKPKPWMSTPSVIEVRDRVRQDPFVWPIAATLADFRAMLRKGNPRPSPGPDGWEKWCVKNLSDRVLQLVLDLHNYSVMHARFPGDLKDTHLTYFHKRGIRTELTNWRGLLISNFLANSPMTWLNYRLMPYAARLGIIPETQVATQPGVQTRDLMSFLSGLKTWSRRNKKTIYLLKRDQMKGFDYLSPHGFYDACEAYGLPSTICDLDQAAQSMTKCFPRTAFGIASPIVVDGVTKQGGPMSPFKATVTTSLGHRYLDDISRLDPDSVVIRSLSNVAGDPHLPNDSLTLSLSMTEATDDSFIIALSHLALRRFTLEMERFQFMYGWLTSWEKTSAHILNSADPLPETLSFPSITNMPGIDPWIITERQVPVSANEFSFLRTQVDDPKSRSFPTM